MQTKIQVRDGDVMDPERVVAVERCSPDRCAISLIDYFVSPGGRPFLRVEMELATLRMTLDGASTCVKTEDAVFALSPLGSDVRVSFQADDWPFAENWITPRHEFTAAIMAIS